MKPRSAVALGVAMVALQLAGCAGLLRVLPAQPAIALAFVASVLAPGYAFVAMGAAPPGGLALAPAWAMGFGIAWNAALVIATRACGVPFTVLATWSVVPGALLWSVAMWRAGRTSSHSGAPARRTLRGVAWAAVALAAALAVVHVARLGTPITYYGDSPDHIGTIRRMLEGGDAFPRDAFFRDAGGAGVDPRKGLWHPQVALIAALARRDPVETWRWLSLAIAPLFVLNAAAFGWLAAGPAGAAATAWAELVVRAGQIGWQPLRKAVFSTFLADQLCLAAMIALIADLDARRRASRLAAIALALAAVTTHVFSAIQLALVAGALLLGIALRDRGWSEAARRGAGTAAAMGLACLPYLAWRALHAYAPANVIHTEPQGLLLVTDRIRMVSVGVLWDWNAMLWALFPLGWWALWRHGRSNAAVLYLLTTSLAVVLVMFDPPVVALLSPRIGYLLMRFVWILPTGPLLGLAAATLPMRFFDAGRPRLRAALAMAVVLALAWPAAHDAALVFARPARFEADETRVSPLPWRDDLMWMDTHLPAGSVVLSDPATSYAVPMFTRHFVVTLVDQHSSPNDSLALTRLLDARDALDPFASWARTRDVVRRYGVDAIALNRRFTEIPRLDYWAPTPGWFDEARVRLDRHPAAFERVRDTGDFVVYRVHRAALDTLDGPPPQRPNVAEFLPGLFPVGRRLGAGLPVIHRLALWPRVVAPGDTLHGVADWRALEPLPAGSYEVAVRFDRTLPGGLAPPAIVAKPVRKLVEIARRERYRFRADHLPTGGAYGVDLWRANEVVRDSFTLEVPRDVADGSYAVGIKMIRQPHYPNYHLSDYFLDRDYYSGVTMGSILVARRP
jgi:hypothetical protein